MNIVMNYIIALGCVKCYGRGGRDSDRMMVVVLMVGGDKCHVKAILGARALLLPLLPYPLKRARQLSSGWHAGWPVVSDEATNSEIWAIYHDEKICTLS